jgi:hypothetical protein
MLGGICTVPFLGFHISFGFADISFYALVLVPDTPRFLFGSSRGIYMCLNQIKP